MKAPFIPDPHVNVMVEEDECWILPQDVREFFPQESFDDTQAKHPIVRLDPEWLALVTVRPWEEDS